MINYVISVGDSTLSNIAKKEFPEAKLIEFNLDKNGSDAFELFDLLKNKAVLITSTSPLHLGKINILNNYSISDYYGYQDYLIMCKENSDITYNTVFPNKSLGGISPIIGNIISKLIKVDNYTWFATPKESTEAALHGKIDLVSKPTNNKNNKIFGLKIVCDITKEFGLKLNFYLITHNNVHNDKALSIFKQEQEYLKTLL